jgi:hypothetical protein
LKDTNGKPVTNARLFFQTSMQLMDMGVASKIVQGQGSSPTYAASFAPDEAFSMDGTWIITLTIQQPGQQAVQTRFYVTLTQPWETRINTRCGHDGTSRCEQRRKPLDDGTLPRHPLCT